MEAKITNTQSDNKKIRIALVYSGINEEYQGKIARGIVDTARKLGHDVAIFAPYSNTTNHTAHDYGEENIYELINYDFFDIVMIMPKTMTCEENTQRIIERAKKANKHVIVLDGNYPGCNNIQIRSTGISEIIEHLVYAHNFVDFMFMGAFKNEPQNHNLVEYIHTLQKLGIDCDRDKILYGEYDKDKAGEAIREYIETGKKIPEAIICANDYMAMGVIEELRINGIYVPDDVVVTGYDGIRSAHAYNPSLTTVSLPFYECGEKAVEISAEVSRRPISAFMNYEITTKLVISESCGCFEKDHSDDNHITNRLYDLLDRHTFYSKRLIRMSQSLTEADTLDETFDYLKEYINDIYVDSFYICISEKFESCIDKAGFATHQKYKHIGYPQKMIMKICRENKEYQPQSEFDTSLMLPSMQKECDKGRVFFFTPIHFQDRSFGYIAMECGEYIGSDALMNIWRMNLSVAIENARVREEHQKQSEKLEKLYTEDPLTGIYNRRGLQNWAAEIFTKAIDSEQEVMILVADLDGLKMINDCFGHKHGDNALIQVARALQKASRGGEICSRFGGDEFEVMAYGYTNEKAQEFIRRFDKALEEYNEANQLPYKISASCGYFVTKITEKSEFESILSEADREMYKVKSERKKKRMETGIF